jgi:hypothetical protein
MTLSEIRGHLANHTLLTYEQFMATNGHDFSGNPEQHFASYMIDAVMLDSVKSKSHYLHYLCYMGREQAVRDWVAWLHTQHEAIEIINILNHHGIYDHYYGTPLHTLSAWNNSVTIAAFLVEQGANPNIKDYYECRPGHEQMDSWFIPSFRIGCEVDDYRNDPSVTKSVCRVAEDFTEINNYLAQFQTE